MFHLYSYPGYYKILHNDFKLLQSESLNNLYRSLALE